MYTFLIDNISEDLTEKHIKAESYKDTVEEILKHQSIHSVLIDDCKLVICTGFGVTVLPYFLHGEKDQLEEWQASLDHEDDLYDCLPNTQTWQSIRPLDSIILDRWNDVRQFASYGNPYGNVRYPQLRRDSESKTTVQMILNDLSESIEVDKCLLKSASFKDPGCEFQVLGDGHMFDIIF
jgi:hypothetical protein